MTSQRPVLRPEDRRPVSDFMADMAAPSGAVEPVVLVRPFAVMSRTSYSNPVTLPIGLAYLAGVLEQAGYPVRILDAVGEDIFRITRSDCGRFNFQGLIADDVVARIPDDAKIIGVSLMFSQEWVPHRHLIRAIRKRFPSAVIVVGGEHASAMTECVLRDCREIDYAIAGEGEMAMLELAHAIYHQQPVGAVAGVSYLDGDDAVVSYGATNRIAVIDQIPRPAWHLCPVENYFVDNWTMGIAMGRNMPILATRGCPYRCSFCSNATMWTTRYKMRTPGDVLDEIADLVRDYRANSIDFFDLTAIVKKDWIIEFCKELQTRGMRFTWQLPSGTRSEALDHEALEAIYQAGCSYLVYAPESGSEQTLEKVHKKVNLQKLIGSVKSAVRIGHVVKVNFVIGFPHERLSHVIKTVMLMLRMAIIGADDGNIAIFTPYPGSELYDELRASGKIPELDDSYFNSLILQFDMTVARCYTDHIAPWQLVLIRNIAQLGFYALAYGLRPVRLVRLFRAIMSTERRAANLFEQRIFDFLARHKLVKSNTKL